MTAPDSTPTREAVAEVLGQSGVTANTWQSAARRLADENRRLREVLTEHEPFSGQGLTWCSAEGCEWGEESRASFAGHIFAAMAPENAQEGPVAPAGDGVALGATEDEKGRESGAERIEGES